ncbi:MAG: S8 family serine peptidase, partial [Anaerolineae bacterium]|nr:S8 family serine peptidase [Anaerolineae bacterium]
DVLDNHKSKAAWDKGFTGQGVKVMVNDSGIDFCHPDLQGTQARITSPDSPYYGWPEMFDSLSMFLWASDNYVGTTYIADGRGDYADTSTTRSGDELVDNGDGTYNLVYKPIGSTDPDGHVYRVPGTSKSGVYHIGSHPDKVLQKYWYNERVAVLVVDEHEPGVYDTVYVDLDDDHDFTNEKPIRKGDEAACKDLDGDGYADVSGGLVYFIADGVNPIPATDWMWKLGVAGNGAHDFGEPGNGDLVAFAIQDFTEAGGDHGQLVASNIAGQGVIDGNAPAWKPSGDGTPGTGMVVGGGKDVKLVANGNFYASPYDEDGFLFSALGYDGIPGTDDDVQIINNSCGSPSGDNDGWQDRDRLYDSIQHINPSLSIVVSTGNYAPGYGTVTPPSPMGAISVGASTQYGSTKFGALELNSMDQITYGDVSSFSSRGPSARGEAGVSVVADGAWGAGDLPLNEVGNGWTAWETWGGTSRSGPVAAGNLALVYDAYRQTHGVWPDYQTARAILMAGADDSNYDVLVQGAGRVNADTATDIAAGLGDVYVVPDSWSFGDYHGVNYPGFANIMYPGKSSTKTFTIYNPGDTDQVVNISTDRLVKIGEMNFDWTTAPVSDEGPYEFPMPDYLRDLTPNIPQGTDLMIIRWTIPMSEFDPNGDLQWDQRWYGAVYDWTDVNGNGKLWTDLDGDGAVDRDAGELDEKEAVLFTYWRPYNIGGQMTVQRPLERTHDGIYLGLIHRQRNEAIPQTHFKFKVEFYQHASWPWLSINPTSTTVPAGGSATFEATMSVPSAAAYGLYEGSIRVDDGSHVSVIPAVVNVAAYSANFAFGGPPASDGPYDNGRIYPAQDWVGRAANGDWRFYMADIPNTPENASLIVDTRWDYPGSDVDIIIMGPTESKYSSQDPDYYGPYTLSTIGRSTDTNQGYGVWLWNTATGTNREIVTAPAQPGLHVIALHNVIFGGDAIYESVTGQAGTIGAQPASIDEVALMNNGTVTVTVNATVPLPDLTVDGFGLGKPETYTDQVVHQDDPDDPSTASYTRTVTIEHGARLAVSVNGQADTDLDLYVYYISPSGPKLVGSSTTPTAQESVSITFPPDGQYMIAVHGWSVPAGITTFDLTIDAVQGYDLQVSNVPSGPFAPGQPIQFTVSWSKDLAEGESAEGLLLLGPSMAPGALAVPVHITAANFTTPMSMDVPVSADTYMHSGEPDTNFSDYPKLRVGRNDTLHSVLWADVSSIPAPYPVDHATLYVWVDSFAGGGSPHELTAHKVLSAWDEATATWNTPWSTPGG